MQLLVGKQNLGFSGLWGGAKRQRAFFFYVPVYWVINGHGHAIFFSLSSLFWFWFSAGLTFLSHSTAFFFSLSKFTVFLAMRECMYVCVGEGEGEGFVVA